MIDPAIFRALVAQGASPEMLLAVVEADAAVEAERSSRQIPWSQLREMAFARDGECCQYCGTGEGPFEIDHVVPRSRGGENVLANVVVACRGCNRAKKDREGEAWELVADRRAKDRVRKRVERAAKSAIVHGHRGRSADTPSFEVSPQTPLPNTNPEIIPPISPRAGGRTGKHRLPEDWSIPAVADLPPKAKICAEQWTAASYETHGEAFVNYWRGNGKMMVDWRGTWANRVIALHSQVLRDQKFGNAPTSSPAGGTAADPEQFRAFCLQSAENCRKMGREHEALDWEAKANGQERRRTSTGPPSSAGDLIAQAARYAKPSQIEQAA